MGEIESLNDDVMK
jgi:hypothetical protein